MGINFNVKATDVELTPEISRAIEEKVADIEKLVDPDDSAIQAQIEVGRTTRHHRKGDIFRAEINLRLGGKNLRAVSKQEDVLSALDKMKEDILRRLRKFKGRQKRMERLGGLRFKNMLRRFRRNNK